MDSFRRSMGLESSSSSSDVRRRLMSVWHSMKYGKTVFNLASDSSKTSACQQPVWMLGKCYHKHGPQTRSQEEQSETERKVIEAFHSDFASRIWMTYRREYETFEGTSLSSDCGWGCMIRSGQMLVANCLLLHYLGREWRYNPRSRVLSDFELMDEARHRSLIRLFGDTSDFKFSPLSIHHLMATAKESISSNPGDWFGPATTAHLISLAMEKSNHPLINELRVYVARDATIYVDDIKHMCKQRPNTMSGASTPDLTDFSIVSVDEASSPSSSSSNLTRSISQMSHSAWKPVMILVPMRLGSDKLNPIYIPSVKMLLATDNCVGFIGGRPKHSVYFVGFQGDHLIHLDPHLAQDNVNVFLTRFQVSSFHCRTARRMSIYKLDPSCCFGFLCTTEEQFDGWCALTHELLSQCGAPYPIFSFVHGCQRDAETSAHLVIDAAKESIANSNEGVGISDEELYEDFVFL